MDAESVSGLLGPNATAMDVIAPDDLLTAVSRLREARDEADDVMRVVLAFAREFARPRPYRLEDLAEAAGMSISGVRTAYGAEHIDTVATLLGRTPTGR
ncbi:hypothetical protein ACIBSV_23425 [Embleya sp. NPDC050154]|uniref:hypothetical protein n=1 Tax=Embleya sp. NPDC050154 TaxID=3363988 RepID=UPI0037940B46